MKNAQDQLLLLLSNLHASIEVGCNADALGPFAAWLSGKSDIHAFIMPGKRYNKRQYQGIRR